MVLAARPVVGTVEEARDCAAQAVLQYLEHDPRDVANLEAFMVTIAKRRAFDHVRGRERTRVRDDRYAHECPLSAPDVAEDVAARAEARWVDQEARRLLQPHVYELLQLIADGVPMSEVATRLGMTQRAVQSHLLRARRTVRAALAESLAALGIAAAAVRRWWGPAAVTAPVLAAALVLAIGTAEAPAPEPPTLTLLPRTSALPALDAARLAGASSSASRRTGSGSVTHHGRNGSASRTELAVTTPVGSVSLEKRDNGHHSDNVVDEWLWCLQHFRHEVGGYIGCDTESAQQGTGQPAGDGPLLPAVR